MPFNSLRADGVGALISIAVFLLQPAPARADAPRARSLAMWNEQQACRARSF
jgi:hypothetical protein